MATNHGYAYIRESDIAVHEEQTESNQHCINPNLEEVKYVWKTGIGKRRVQIGHQPWMRSYTGILRFFLKFLGYLAHSRIVLKYSSLIFQSFSCRVNVARYSSLNCATVQPSATIFSICTSRQANKSYICSFVHSSILSIALADISLSGFHNKAATREQ